MFVINQLQFNLRVSFKGSENTAVDFIKNLMEVNVRIRSISLSKTISRCRKTWISSDF